MTYPERLLDHYRDPRHRGPLTGATHEHQERNVLCGDEVTMRFRVKGRVVEQAAFEGVGCVYCVAAASLLCEHVVGMDHDAAAAIQDTAMLAWLEVDVPKGRHDCATLPLVALRQALS